MLNIVTERFIECHGSLKENGDIKTNSEFAAALDYSPQGISEILNRRRDITIDLLRKAVDKYAINPVYLTLGEGPMFLNETNPSGLQILSIVTNSSNRERIVHVPTTAQAGYAEELSDPTFLEELPTYTLPDYDFSQGTYRSFDVEGDSMIPTLHHGDRVVCKYVDPNYWVHSIKENQVYVIVTAEGVIVKRIKNQLKRDQTLGICSDNKSYGEYSLNAPRLKEVWKVEYVLKKFDHFRGGQIRGNKDEKLDKIIAMMETQESKVDKIYNELSFKNISEIDL